MDSMKNQNALTAIICFRSTKFKEDFRSTKFRDLPIVVQLLDTLDERNGSQPSDSINPLVLYERSSSDGFYYDYCEFCRGLFFTTGYSLSQEFVDETFRINPRIVFHNKYIEPMVKKSPYHPKHSLQVLTYPIGLPSNRRCYCCYLYKQSFRYCSICDFRICHGCVFGKEILTIEYKKRHEHTLSYICREASMTCDVCGLDDRRYFIYACHQCDYIVHKECIYFPSLIKIFRHEHRITFTSSFLIGELFCGVCRKQIDENYGGYSCVKGNCSYVVHSKYVICGDVWDGKELEGKPEDAYEDITPFKEIGEGVIKHFSHNHYMKLQEVIDHKVNNRCQACTLLIYDDDIFSCMECDYVLHKACAYLPMKKQHAMYPHPLKLIDGNTKTKFSCSTCHRESNGFKYKYGNSFMLDMHCASVSEPFNHHCHIHPLFLPSKSGSKRICLICDSSQQTNYLECGECDFVLCFGCTTLPKKYMYKHDKHSLILSFENETRERYWCDMCEEEINPKHGVYMCKDCNVTLHIKCLLGGEEMYILPGKILTETTYLGLEMDNSIIINNLITRHICKHCSKRCKGKIFYKSFMDGICCSILCLYYNIKLDPESTYEYSQ